MTEGNGRLDFERCADSCGQVEEGHTKVCHLLASNLALLLVCMVVCMVVVGCVCVCGQHSTWWQTAQSRQHMCSVIRPDMAGCTSTPSTHHSTQVYMCGQSITCQHLQHKNPHTSTNTPTHLYDVPLVQLQWCTRRLLSQRTRTHNARRHATATHLQYIAPPPPPPTPAATEFQHTGRDAMAGVQRKQDTRVGHVC